MKDGSGAPIDHGEKRDNGNGVGTRLLFFLLNQLILKATVPSQRKTSAIARRHFLLVF